MPRLTQQLCNFLQTKWEEAQYRKDMSSIVSLTPSHLKSGMVAYLLTDIGKNECAKAFFLARTQDSLSMCNRSDHAQFVYPDLVQGAVSVTAQRAIMT